MRSRAPGPSWARARSTLSPDGRYAYVASSRSDAIAIFARNERTGALLQRSGTDGCVAAKGAGGCAKAIGLDGPNSVALSPDGRYLYATSRNSNSVAAFRRNASTGALTQLRGGAGCVSGLPVPGCGTGRALVGPDVLVVSPDGRNVYVGSFFGNAVAVFARSASTGALTQPAETAGCIAASATSSCATALGLEAPEGMAISADGTSLYVAGALSNALVAFARDTSTGALAQPTDGSGCIVESPLTGCTTGVQLSGANAVTVSPDDDDVYVTSLFSDSVTSFSRSPAPLAQKPGTAGCLIYLRAAGCSFGRALSAPEGLAVSPDGGERLRRRLRHRRDRRPRPGQEIRRARAEARPRRLHRAQVGARLLARTGAARRQLDRRQPRRPPRLLDLVRQQRRRRLPEEQMTESEQKALTRKQLLGTGAGAAAAALLARSGGIERALAASKGKRRDVAGMNVVLFLTDQERAIQHFPPGLGAAEPARADAGCAATG